MILQLMNLIPYVLLNNLYKNYFDMLNTSFTVIRTKALKHIQPTRGVGTGGIHYDYKLISKILLHWQQQIKISNVSYKRYHWNAVNIRINIENTIVTFYAPHVLKVMIALILAMKHNHKFLPSTIMLPLQKYLASTFKWSEKKWILYHVTFKI